MVPGVLRAEEPLKPNVIKESSHLWYCENDHTLQEIAPSYPVNRYTVWSPEMSLKKDISTIKGMYVMHLYH